MRYDYNYLLKKIIDESELSLEKLSARCAELGITVSPKYLSTLRKAPTRKLGEEKAKILAKACGKHEDLLIVQGYYDSAPRVFKNILRNIRHIAVRVVLQVFKKKYSKPMVKMAKKWLSTLTMAEFYVDMNELNMKSVTRMFTKAITGAEIIGQPPEQAIENCMAWLSNYELDETDDLQMYDDSMSPALPKGGKISTEFVESLAECRNGNILLYTNTKKERMQIKRIQFLDEEHTKFLMQQDNRNSQGFEEAETLEEKDIIIIGRVTHVTVEVK